MKQTLYIVSATLLTIGLVGCSATQTTTTTNETVNTNGDTVVEITNTEQGSDTNTSVVLENSNSDANADAADVNADTVGDTTVDTSDWLTYTNEEYGFSFRYPNDWIVTEQTNKLAKNEEIRIRFSPPDYQPEGSYGDMLYNPDLASISYYNVPFEYYGSLLLNEVEEDLVIDGIVVKKVVGQVYNNGPEEIMVYMPNSSNDQHLQVILNVVEGEYTKIFDKVIFSTRW